MQRCIQFYQKAKQTHHSGTYDITIYASLIPPLCAQEKALRVLEGSIALGGLVPLILTARDHHQARTDGRDPNAPQQRDGILGARGMLAGCTRRGRRGGVFRWLLTAHKGGFTKKSPTKEVVEEHVGLYLERGGPRPNQYAQHAVAACSGIIAQSRSVEGSGSAILMKTTSKLPRFALYGSTCMISEALILSRR